MRAVLSRRMLEDAVLVHQDPGERDATGRFQPGVERATPIRVVTYPAPQNGQRRSAKRVDLRVAARLVDSRYFLTEDLEAAAIRVGSTETDADQVSWDGARWVVVSVDRWILQGFLRLVTQRAVKFQVVSSGAVFAGGRPAGEAQLNV